MKSYINIDENTNSPQINNEYSQDNVIKLILLNFIKQTSLNAVVNDIQTLSTKNEEEIELKDKIPLEPIDVFSIIYKTCGQTKLYSCLLDIMDTKNSVNSKGKVNKKEKLVNTNINNKINKKKKIKEKSVNKKYNHNNKKEDIVIEINNEKEKSPFTEIINLNESQSSGEDNNNNSGKKTEIKSKRRRKIKMLKSAHSKVKKCELKSEIKINNHKKELNPKNECKLSYHYSFILDNIYKYKITDFNEKENKAIFSCDDSNCAANAEYSLINKLFILKNEHNIAHNKHEYIQNMSSKDSQITEYMNKNKILNLQIMNKS